MKFSPRVKADHEINVSWADFKTVATERTDEEHVDSPGRTTRWDGGFSRWGTITSRATSWFAPYNPAFPQIPNDPLLKQPTHVENLKLYITATRQFCIFSITSMTTIFLSLVSEIGASPFWFTVSIIGSLWLPIGAVHALNNANAGRLLILNVMFLYAQQYVMCILFLLFLFGGPFLMWSNIPLLLGTVASALSFYQGWLTIRETRRIRNGEDIFYPDQLKQSYYHPFSRRSQPQILH